MNCFTNFFKKKNLGHRLYGDVVGPENSMHSLGEGLKNQYKEEFIEWEFDVTEADKKLWVWHDTVNGKTIDRMCPNAPSWLKGTQLHKLRTVDIKRLRLLDTDEKIPSPLDVLNVFKWQAIKPVNIEIKRLTTENAQSKLIGWVKQAQVANGKVEFYFSIGKKKFKKLPDGEQFLEICKSHKIRVKFL